MDHHQLHFAPVGSGEGAERRQDWGRARGGACSGNCILFPAVSPVVVTAAPGTRQALNKCSLLLESSSVNGVREFTLLIEEEALSCFALS